MTKAGYRVRFTNWREGKDEYFFETKEQAQKYLNYYEGYSYTGIIETIYFQENR